MTIFDIADSGAIPSGSIDRGDIKNSLRFRATGAQEPHMWKWGVNDPAALYQKATISAWVKPAITGRVRVICSSMSDSNNVNQLYIQNTGAIGVYGAYASATTYYKESTVLFRDPSAWYHVEVYIDTTQAVAEDRIKIYVNGERVTSWSINTNPALNSYGWIFASTWQSRVGVSANVGQFFDGYLARLCLTDRISMPVNSFAYRNPVTGQWISKTFAECKALVDSGGPNSYMLEFLNATTTLALGTDSSSKGNSFTTVTGFSVTAGVNYDWMLETPSNNFCILNPLSSTGAAVLLPENGSLTQTANVSNWQGRAGSIAVSSGKWYWEVTTNVTPATDAVMIGIDRATRNYLAIGNFPGDAVSGYGYYNSAGTKYSGATGSAYAVGYGSGDIIGVALDLDAGTLTFYKNGVSLGVAFTGITGEWLPACAVYTAAVNISANFGQRPFTYAPPTGHKTLCMDNMPEPPIPNGRMHQTTTNYAGTSAPQNVNNGYFPPGFIRIKTRNLGGVNNAHTAADIVRGITTAGMISLSTNSNAAEVTYPGYGVSAVNPTGFSLIGNGSLTNLTGNSYVAQQWKAGDAIVTNNDGTVTSQVSVNKAAGFSIVSFNAGAAGNKTVGHGLGKIPALWIFKSRTSAANWPVGGTVFANPSQGNMLFNLPNAGSNDSRMWANSPPTSTTISFESGYTGFANDNCIAYCFANIDGYSKFGSYVGNGSADGIFVYCGFRPGYLLIKRADSSGGDWWEYDSARDPVNPNFHLLYVNLADAESTSGTNRQDLLSNGFKIRDSGADNVSGATYIYMAFAENPFKYANAR